MLGKLGATNIQPSQFKPNHNEGLVDWWFSYLGALVLWNDSKTDYNCSGSEIDIHAVGGGVTGQISVYSKVKVRAEDGTTTVSSLEAPAIDISSEGGDIELNGIKIANSILGEAVKLRSKSGDIRLKKRTLGDVMALTHGNVTAGTVQSLKIDIRGNNVQLESAYAGSGIIRAHNDIKLKNLNGDFDVEAGGDVMIDGCDGTLELVAKNEVNVHLDSSVKRAHIKGFKKIN